MPALILALIPIIRGLVSGVAIGIVLKSLTIPEWLAIAGAVTALADPQVEAELSKLNPVLSLLIKDAHLFGPTTAADNASRVAFGYEDPNSTSVF